MDEFSVFFQGFMEEGLLKSENKALCVGAKEGQQVLALREIGVSDAVVRRAVCNVSLAGESSLLTNTRCRLVGIPTMSLSVPHFINLPILATTKAVVDLVPRPNTMSLSTYSTALSATSFFKSSCVRILLAVMALKLSLNPLIGVFFLLRRRVL